MSIRFLLFIFVFVMSFGVMAAELKLVQSGAAQSTGNGTVSVPVTAVDMSKSFLVFQTRSNSNRPPGSTLLGKLASSTSLEFVRATNESSTIDIQWYLVEFTSGVFVQRGDVVQSSSTSNVSLGTALGSASQAFVLYSKHVNNTDSSYSSDDPIYGEITSSTNLKLKANNSNSDHTIHWQVVEFTDASMSVQAGFDAITSSGTTTTNDNFGTNVDLTKAMLLTGFISDDSGDDIDERLVTAEFNDTNTVTFTRGDNGGDDLNEIVYQVIEFSDGTRVQTGSSSFAPGDTSNTITINSVDTSKSIALSTVQAWSGQNLGRSEYGGDDIVGETSFTMNFTSSTSLQIQRNASNDNAVVQWQVVEFNDDITGFVTPVVDWHFDEESWDGTTGEVIDNQGVINGRSISGADTQASAQICRSASFDGIDDYLSMTGLDTYLRSTSSLSFWIKTSQTGDAINWRSPGVTGVEMVGCCEDIFWGWLDNSGHIGLGTGDDGQILSPNAINDNTWHHVVLTRDSATGHLYSYVDGNLANSNTNLVLPGDIATAFSSIGRIEDDGGTPEYYGGSLDEVLIFDAVIGAAQVSSIYTNQLAGNDWNGAARTCPLLSGSCENVFSGGLQTSSTSAKVEFKKNSQLLSNPTTSIPTSSIENNHSSSCGGSACVASGTVNDALTIPTFLNYNSGPKIEVSGTQTVGASDNEFEEIKVKKNATLTFSANQSIYIIETLKLEDNTTINFVAGDYYIEELKVDKKNVAINVIGAGTVRIWSTNDIKFKDTALVNSPSYGLAGTPSKLVISTTKKLKIEKKATVSAFVSVKDFELKDDSYFFGAATASNKIKLDDDAVATFVSNDLNNTDFGGACSTGVSVPDLDHFLISHDGAGINCVAEVITVTAIDALGATLDTYAEGITLDTQTAKGTWSLSSGNGAFADLTSNDGLATYSFVDTDNGIAQFTLSYTEGAANLDIEAYQSSDTALRDDDTEAALVFSPSGFTLTQSALSNPPPNPINDPIITQTAGSNFNVHLAAYGQTPTDPTCGIIESYTGAKPLSLWFDYEDPSSGTLTPTIDASGIASSEGASSGQNVTFTNGQASVAAKYKDVGRIQLHAKDGLISGSTNQFVVKPADLVFVDIEDGSAVNNPAASSAIGSGFVTAGEAFTATIEVRDAEGDRTPNFGNESIPEGIEIIAPSLMLPAGGRNGSLDDGAIANNSSFSAITPLGSFRSTTLSWDEVGIIRLQASILDDDYLGIGEVTGTISGNVGRFYPASYSLNASTVTASCSGFTYMDEPAISVSYQLLAIGLAGNTLFNYDRSLLGVSAVSAISFHAENANAGTELNSRLTLSLSTWVNGIYSANTTANQFSRLTSVDGPYNSLQLGIRATDSLDGVLISSLDMNPSSNTDCASLVNCNTKQLGSSTSVLYGRLEVSPAFGPETEPLGVPIFASYYDGSGFVVNTLDSCTTFINANTNLSNYQGGLPAVTVDTPVALTLLLFGESSLSNQLTLSAPGAGNDGSVDLSYDASSWLEYNWNGSGDEDPENTASFGHFRGHDRVIYWREVFN